jgi:nitrate/TMAO reductase-like tetraheme cytochrome c subunit
MSKSQKQLDERLAEILKEHNASNCRHCGHKIGWGDIAWNNGSTEAGTGYSTVQITCEGCAQEVAHFNSWFSPIDNQEDLLYVMTDDWQNGSTK